MPTPAHSSVDIKHLQEKIQGFSEDLLDLTYRNPLISAKLESSRSKSIRVPGQSLNTALKWLTEDVKKTPILSAEYKDLPVEELPEQDILQTDLEEADFLSRMKFLRKKQKEILQERGNNVLYAAFGFIRWKDPSSKTGGSHDSPLTLMPMEIHEKVTRSGKLFLACSFGERLATNTAFREKISTDFGIQITKYREQDENIEEYLESLKQELPKSLEYEIIPEIVFGIFPHHRMEMYFALKGEDYHKSPMIQNLFGKPSGETGMGLYSSNHDVDKPEIESKVPYLVQDADASQFSALVDIANEKNLAIEGPPGTGKSQTIINAIAAALGEGKKVLFVAEKSAALDVVRSRLRKLGLEPFLLPLYGKGSIKREVFESLKKRIELQKSNESSSADFEREQASFRRARTEIDSYRNFLKSDFQNTGKSVHEILGLSIRTEKNLEPVLAILEELYPFCMQIQRGISLDTLLEETRDFAIRFQENHTRIPEQEAYWKGYRGSLQDTKGVLEIAKITAGEYVQASKRRQALEGIPPETPNAALRSLQTHLDTIPDSAKDFLHRLCESGKTQECREFLDRCQGLQRTTRDLESLLMNGEKLTERRRQVAKIFNDPHNLSAKEFSQARVTLRDAGIFAFLSSSHRKAKSLYKRSCKRGNYSQKQAVQDITRLLEWKKAQRVFYTDFHAFFGINKEETTPSGKRKAPQELRRQAQLVQEAIQEPDTNIHELSDHLKHWLQDYRSRRDALDSATDLKQILGPDFKGSETLYPVDRSLLETLESTDLLAEYGKIAFAKGFLGTENLQKVLVADQRAHDALEKLVKISRIQGFQEPRSPQEQIAYLQRACEDTRGLETHSTYSSLLQEARERGWIPVLEYFQARDLPIQGLQEILEAVIVRYHADNMQKEHTDILQKFQGKDLQALREDLAEADCKVIELSQQQVIQNLLESAAEPPKGNHKGSRGTWTEMSLINNEINKKSRHIPIRDLVYRASDSLLELKPCWMMSPLDAAKYLSGANNKITFDLCIIDEASQMPPEDSIGVLASCKQAVIVGDRNQLPPTSFFRKVAGNYEEDLDQDFIGESILDMANLAFQPMRRLRWHYRSRDSSLIAFCNHHVYDNHLVVFPSPAKGSRDLGVEIKYIPDAVYHKGTNEKEADTMIEATLEFMRRYPDRSLGIAVMNSSQADLLDKKWDLVQAQNDITREYCERWKEQDGGLEEFFIKNLENVQGDERDVIFVGTVYGKDATGKMSQAFGPVNQAAGYRRLNVLFSRSREKIVTFTSMHATEIQTGKNRGRDMFHHWLAYCNTGQISTGEDTRKEPDSDFERQVIQVLESLGCEAVPQVGVQGYYIDIGVRHPKWPHGYIMGVECDGKTYHSSMSARERDRLREQVLRGLGWEIYRIWSTDWFYHQHAEISRLKEAIQERLQTLTENNSKA